ncbi:hypothetical protein P5G65_04225 [Paenibacillus chondroitinus]|uniref:SLAP domain-containing protein n=1 Tax=Paenibacillus chondroitinus TaxID=59842 RepID=A0ABU6D5T5_9BACL|nr:MULTISPECIES: hypothetical protein [Paenibacillus]MCY9660051.1 hypothetical protein [Paenibacillus anseongense]MEB4793090.1 hypothetical protein [Paenibacillus chondroitinus]
MSVVKLPQPYALRLEMISAKGYLKTEITEIVVRYKEAELKELVRSDVDWKGFVTYRDEHLETLLSAINDGYQFSFITFGGIKNLLAIKFNKLEGADYDIVESSFLNLTLSPEQFQLLRFLVPNHWNMSLTPFVSETGEEIDRVHIELQHR